VDLERGKSFGFLGLEFRDLRSLRGVMRPHYAPKLKKRPALNFPERPRQADKP
jgi:RNA-directed DNA polymerase